MNRSILLSLILIFAVTGLVAGLAVAYFSDQGTSNDNVFNSGTLDMKLSDANETGTTLDSVSGTWGLASAPGDDFTGDLNIRNSGNVPADHIELAFANVVTESLVAPGITATIPMDTVIEITELKFDTNADGDFLDTDEDLLVGVVAGANGIKDLNDLEGTTFDNIAFLGTESNNHILRMAGQLHPTLTVDQHQGDSVNMTLTVDMNQDVSQ